VNGQHPGETHADHDLIDDGLSVRLGRRTNTWICSASSDEACVPRRSEVFSHKVCLLFFSNAAPHGDNGDSVPRYSIFKPFSGYFEYKGCRRKRGLYTQLQSSAETFLQIGRSSAPCTSWLKYLSH